MTGNLSTATFTTVDGEKRLHVVQGEQYVTDDKQVMLGTILGSCVAACMYDSAIGLGGLNHFLLPGDGDAGLRHGVHAMELLVNALLQRGARRERLKAHLFGGARMFNGLTDVGTQNAAFAERFLAREGIVHAGGSLGGDQARRVQFWPASGRVRQRLLAPTEREAFKTERFVPPARVEPEGELELF